MRLKRNYTQGRSVDSIQQAHRIEVHLGDVLEVSGVLDLYDKLKQALEGDSSLSVDASGVDRVDTASLQMLVSLAEYAKRNKRDISVQSASEAFVKTAKMLGVSAALGLQ